MKQINKEIIMDIVKDYISDDWGSKQFWDKPKHPITGVFVPWRFCEVSKGRFSCADCCMINRGRCEDGVKYLEESDI